MIPLYVVDIARQHAAAHPGRRDASPRRRLARAAVVILVLATAALLLEIGR